MELADQRTKLVSAGKTQYLGFEESNVKCDSQSDMIHIMVKIDGVIHDMELDAGCKHSIISVEFWESKLMWNLSLLHACSKHIKGNDLSH